MAASTFPVLQRLSNSIPLDGAVQLDLVEGVLIFRASVQVQARVEVLLEKQQSEGLTEAEEEELDCYEEIDDYLSFVNRTVRNAAAGSMVA
ncbi:hypothetical protein [Picosynechococcus sp. PCC 7117]|uniref:hypothetical protein n=1 Tax=Picosynechococcus sp. PCC 7117 TaxID=195498 RepID=UPI000810C533|nr:hypothetical protein [Picosynechococcus sp. PCC 7117]ANV86591.1 hypothetical protein AWQ22_03380 [Picosynechococcus sp. PCC 7117]